MNLFNKLCQAGAGSSRNVLIIGDTVPKYIQLDDVSLHKIKPLTKQGLSYGANYY